MNAMNVTTTNNSWIRRHLDAVLIAGVSASLVIGASIVGVLVVEDNTSDSSTPTSSYLATAKNSTNLEWTDQQWITFAGAVCRDKHAGVSEEFTSAQALPSVGVTYKSSKKVVRAAIEAYCPETEGTST
jgi:hypothetical protein